MANALCFNLSAEAREAGSILVLIVEVNVENTSVIVSSINSSWNIAQHTADDFEIFLLLEFIQIIQVWVDYFKSFNRVKSTQDE